MAGGANLNGPDWQAESEEEALMESRVCTVGVDMGTTHVKTVAFSADDHELARAEETLSVDHDESGTALQSPDRVYAAATRIEPRLKGQSPSTKGSIG